MRYKKILIFVVLVIVVSSFFIFSAEDEKQNDKEEEKEIYVPEKDIFEMTEEELDAFLESTNSLGLEERLKKIIKARTGTPYVLGPLGEGKGKDPNPVFRVDVSDCTVFVLTTVAMANSSSTKEAEEAMEAINYYPAGEVSYDNRLHFTTYRNSVSPYFKDITREINKAESKTVVLNRQRGVEGRIIDINFEETMTVYYVPSSVLSEEALMQLPSVSGVAFLRHGDENIGLDVRHEGFLINGKQIVHASNERGEVVKENFFEYLFNNGVARFDGVIFFEVLEV